VENARLFEVSYMVGEGENDEGDIWESDVTVPWDEDLDGAELTVKILDAGGATTRASWTLEVL
jgi:transketolase N-terminal domain/subunit